MKTYTLLDDLKCKGLSIMGNSFGDDKWIFNANNKNITANNIAIFGSDYWSVEEMITVYMGSGTWELVGGREFRCSNTTVLYPESSVIKIGEPETGHSFGFNGGGQTFNNIWVLDNVSMGVAGNNTFNNFKIEPGSDIYFGETTTTLSTLDAIGTVSNYIQMDNGVFSKSSGVVNCDYLVLENMIATGGATWNAGNNSVDGGGNEGWIFPSAIILVNSGEVIFTNPSVSVTGKATIDLNVNEIVVFNPSVSVTGKATIDLNVNEVIFTSPSVDATGETVVTVSASEVVFDTKRADVIGEAIANVNTNEIVFFNPIIDVIGEAIIDVSANETNLNSLGVNITGGEGISFDTSTDQAIFTNLAIKAVEQGGGYSPLASILNFISPEITVETEYNWYFPNKANSKWKKLEAVQTEWTKNSKIKTNWKKI